MNVECIESLCEEDKFSKTISERMDYVRQLKHWTYSDLAEACGLSTSSVYRMCKGELVPKSRSLAKICLALDVDSNYMLGLTQRLVRWGA